MAGRAFTLIELLTVISVIAILAAILMPALAQARKAGNMAVSESNLRQLGVAIHGYVQDTGVYPPGSDAGLQWTTAGSEFTATWRGYWSDVISAYLGNKDDYWGSDISPILDSPAKAIKTPTPEVAFTPNPQLIQDCQWGGGQIVRASRVQRVSSVILLGDGAQDPTTGYVAFLPWQQQGVYDTNAANAQLYLPATENLDNGNAKFRFRYPNNTGHFLFCDGHVELIQNGKLQYRNFAINY